MNHHYFKVIGCFLFCFSGYDISIAQSPGPEFLTCTDTVLSLCVQDEGVRLPDNNQVYLGEGHPDATSCSVHVTQKKRVRSTCGDTLQYEVLLFLNDTSPVVTLIALTSIVVDSSGEAELVFDTETSSDSLFTSSGIPYNSACGSFHRIQWIVRDSCGGEEICESKIELYDCNPPSAIPSTEIFTAVIPIGCQLTMHAIDYYIGGMDDCYGEEQFDFSFNEDKYNPDSIIHCPSALGVELISKIWIADAGMDQNCDGQIEWSERNRTELPFNIVFILLNDGCCEPVDTGYTISGNVLTEFGQGVKGVEITLHAPGHIFPTYITDSDGMYSFHDILIPGEIEITAYKNDFHRNGVSTLDLVKIQKHLLGKETLESPYKIIAADANNSWNVSAIDLIELRKLILGIYIELPANESWRFVRKDFVFQQPDYPWSDWISWANGDGETITVNGNSNQNSLDFIGIKIGDVNGTVQPNATQLLPRQPLTPFDLKTDQLSYKAGDFINVPIRISSDQTLSGFQFTMTTSGMEIINLLPGAIAISEEHYALFEDQFTISWFDENTLDVTAGDILFTVQVRAKESGTLSQSLSINSDITNAELYLANEETFLPVLKIQDQHAEGKLQITSCAPNPWKEETIVNFYLPNSDEVTFTLFDVSGREILSTSKFLKSGYQQYQLKASDFTDRGMMFFKISTAEQHVFRKMIVLER